MNARPSALTRRRFLAGTASTLGAFAFVPSHVLGLRGAVPANSRLNIACIGVGGRGRANVEGVSSENIVALCDVDARHAAGTFSKFSKAKIYRDYRRMLEEMDQGIDAVVVSTPDHTHAVPVVQALRMGKHVYCEKPLAHSIAEIRAIQKAAQESKKATQLGNQGHSYETIRAFCEWIWDGAIGTVREVHAFCRSSYGRVADLDALRESHPVPETLDWDLWLGPAPRRPYHPAYLPGKWRGWSQFGTGVVGDWTCHILDPVFWALDLGAPSQIAAQTFGYDPAKHFETFPAATRIRYDFPARGQRPAFPVFWYDGEQKPERPDELPKDQNLPGIGALVIGDKGKIVYGSHGASGLKILPHERDEEYREKSPSKSLARSPGHYKEWIMACKEGSPCSSHFGYGGALTEIALLGVIAIRLAGQKLQWDAPKMEFKNSSAANQLVGSVYRDGWKI